jgi:exonuclease III
MSVISWNCRGLGNPSAVLHLKYLVRKYKPDVMILYETLSNANKINDLRYVLGFDNCMAADRDGRGGGVAVYWMSHIGCVITNYSHNHIDMTVNDPIRGAWRLTGFYGYPKGSRRRDSWNFLRQLSRSSTLPWCVIGDFNDILSSDEKKEELIEQIG